MSRSKNADLGRWGEECVRQRLERQGVEILAVNWHCRWGELDIVAANDRVIAFIEVKTRRSSDVSLPREAVTPAKQRRIILSAMQWLSQHPQEQRQPRFDVAEVYAPTPSLPPKMIYLPNAFQAEDTEQF